jgi:hypothetical protein
MVHSGVHDWPLLEAAAAYAFPPLAPSPAPVRESGSAEGLQLRCPAGLDSRHCRLYAAGEGGAPHTSRSLEATTFWGEVLDGASAPQLATAASQLGRYHEIKFVELELGMVRSLREGSHLVSQRSA